MSKTKQDNEQNNFEDLAELKNKWTKEQEMIKSKIIYNDTKDYNSRLSEIIVGGLDISFIGKLYNLIISDVYVYFKIISNV